MNWKRYLPIIGIAILIYLLYKIGINNIIDSFKEIKIIYVILHLISAPLLLLFFAIKWDVLLRGQGVRLKLKDMLKIFLSGWAYGIITPGRIGSFLRINFLKDKTGRSFGFCSSSVILDRIMDTIGLFSMAFLGSLLIIKEYSNLYIIFLVLIVALIIGLTILLNKKITRFFIQKAHKMFIPKKFQERTSEAFESFYENLPTKRAIIISFLLSLAVWFSAYAVTYLMALALNIQIPFLYLALIYPIGGVVGMLPITISGFGTREATLIVLFSQFGITAAEIVSLSISATLIGMYIPALLILIFLRK